MKIHFVSSIIHKLPLRIVLIVPFVLQLLGSVGLVNYLSYRSGQQALENPASKFW